MDLTPWIARGFPGNFDQGIANVHVAGIDKEQAIGMVRVCPETEDYLYTGGYSATRISYRAGARPVLEEIAAAFPRATAMATARAASTWVANQVEHPFICGYVRPDRAMTEEELIDSKVGWCNEQARVFIALCEVCELPARLLFEFHANQLSGHTTAEVWLHNRWVWFDPTFDVTAVLPDGTPAEARELSGAYRQRAHDAYRPALISAYGKLDACIDETPGWRRGERPEIDAGGDLLAWIGVCNYLIDGVSAA